jgi:hypothetical protein
VPAPRLKTPTVVKNTGHIIVQKLPGFLTKKNQLECMFEVGRRVRDEKETYSPGSSDLSAGWNSLGRIPNISGGARITT